MSATSYSFVSLDRAPTQPALRVATPPVSVWAIKYNGIYVTGEEFATRAAAYLRVQQLAKLVNTSALCFRAEEIFL